MATAQPHDSPESYIKVARVFRNDMKEARGQYEAAAQLYREAIARALEAGVPAQTLADALDVTRDAIYKAARS